jgi:hypothetical protein
MVTAFALVLFGTEPPLGLDHRGNFCRTHRSHVSETLKSDPRIFQRNKLKWPRSGSGSIAARWNNVAVIEVQHRRRAKP